MKIRRNALRELVHLTPRLDRYLSIRLEAGTPPLTVTQLYILDRIAQGPTRSVDLARRARVSGATMSKILDRLVAAQWIAREVDADDRRAFVISLTALGAELLRTRNLAIEDDLATLLRSSSVADMEAIERATNVLAAALDRRIAEVLA